MNDAIAQGIGFENAAEFHRMVAAVDLSTSGRVADFKRWQDEDGSKDGLARLAHHTPAEPR